jgi:stage III sporulation protein AD
MRVVAMAVCVRITAELCRDSGERAVAAKIEIAGAVLSLACALPLVEQALTLIGGL